jgi:hypothetical protein
MSSNLRFELGEQNKCIPESTKTQKIKPAFIFFTKYYKQWTWGVYEARAADINFPTFGYMQNYDVGISLRSVTSDF